MLKLFLDGGTEVLMNNMSALIIGNIVAFIVALLAIKFLLVLLQSMDSKLSVGIVLS